MFWSNILGVRMIAKYDPNNVTSPWFLDKVLGTFTRGVPCRSTLLREVKDLPGASDEIETELCDVACHRKWIYSGNFNFFKNLNHKSFKKNVVTFP